MVLKTVHFLANILCMRQVGLILSCLKIATKLNVANVQKQERSKEVLSQYFSWQKLGIQTKKIILVFEDCPFLGQYSMHAPDTAQSFRPKNSHNSQNCKLFYNIYRIKRGLTRFYHNTFPDKNWAFELRKLFWFLGQYSVQAPGGAHSFRPKNSHLSQSCKMLKNLYMTKISLKFEPA